MKEPADEIYTPGHDGTAVSFMGHRRAAPHAAFFAARLRAGMSLLDCGCGPGTITLDLARLVRPGPVIGIDRSARQFAPARLTAREERLSLRFEEGSIYALGLPDASVDAVFAHALFEHLRDPAAAAAEVLRVLKPGGFCGLRSPDWGGFLLHPSSPALERSLARYRELMTQNGGDCLAGRKLAALLRAAGFARVEPSASYEIYRDPELIANYLARQLERHDAGAAQAFCAWARDPDALFAQAWGEALGWKAS